MLLTALSLTPFMLDGRLVKLSQHAPISYRKREETNNRLTFLNSAVALKKKKINLTSSCTENLQIQTSATCKHNRVQPTEINLSVCSSGWCKRPYTTGWSTCLQKWSNDREHSHIKQPLESRCYPDWAFIKTTTIP